MCIVELVDYNETMLCLQRTCKGQDNPSPPHHQKSSAEVINPAEEVRQEIAEEVKEPVKKPRRTAKKEPDAEESPELPAEGRTGGTKE